MGSVPGGEDPPEQDMVATRLQYPFSFILNWRILALQCWRWFLPVDRGACGLRPVELQRIVTRLSTRAHAYTHTHAEDGPEDLPLWRS